MRLMKEDFQERAFLQTKKIIGVSHTSEIKLQYCREKIYTFFIIPSRATLSDIRMPSILTPIFSLQLSKNNEKA